MTPRKFIGLILFLAVTGLSACGGGGGDDANSGGVVTLTPSKTVALADGNDTVNVRADVKNPDGTAVADGTTITFSATDSSGPLSTSTAVTTNGTASMSLNHGPVTGAKKQTVTVTAAAIGASGATEVKFINQPASVDVWVKFGQAVTNLAGLQFKLNNTVGASFDNDAQKTSAVNNAAGSLVACHFDVAANTTSIGLANGGASGFDTGTEPIIKITFAVSAGLPSFNVDPTPASFTATADANGGATVPPATAADMVVTVTYDTEL